MKLRLVDDWRRSPRWWSTRLSALLTALSALQMIMSVWEAAVPPQVFYVVTAMLGTWIIVARVLKQHFEEDSTHAQGTTETDLEISGRHTGDFADRSGNLPEREI